MSRPAQIDFLSRFAGVYDPVVRFMGFPPLWRAIADAATPAPGEFALDVCTGTGGVAIELARRGAQVIGLDLAAGMLQRAAAKRNDGAGPLFVRMDARRLAFGDGTFGLVTCAMALHEMAEDERAQVLAEIRRVASARVVIAEYRVSRGCAGSWLFRTRRSYEYAESDDFEGFVRRDFADRLRQARLLPGTPRDVGAYRVWPCRVQKP